MVDRGEEVYHHKKSGGVGTAGTKAVLRPAESLVARKPQGLCVWVVRCFHPKHNKPCAQRAKGLHSLSSPLFPFSKMINLSVFVAAPKKFSSHFAAATPSEPRGERGNNLIKAILLFKKNNMESLFKLSI